MSWRGPALLLSFAVFTVIILAVTVPPLIFVEETLHNPRTVSIEYYIVGNNLTVTITYSGSIPLTNVSIGVGNRTVTLGDLHKGDTVSGTLNIEGLSPPLNLSVSFSVFNLYPMKVIYSVNP